jgi:hypothetical protein
MLRFLEFLKFLKNFLLESYLVFASGIGIETPLKVSFFPNQQKLSLANIIATAMAAAKNQFIFLTLFLST